MTNIRRALEAAAGVGGGDPVYVEDVFSPYVFTANGGTGQTITNGIDLAGEGGLVWHKDRVATYGHVLWDTARGNDVYLNTAGTGANQTSTDSITFNADGYDLNAATGNESTNATVGWTFRKAPGFFDVVKWTSTTTFENISHNIGSVPGFVVYKCLTSTSDVTGGDWACWHTSGASNNNLFLNTTAAEVTYGYISGRTSTQCNFYTTVGEDYVAYFFATDQADFGADSDESIIKCGSYTGNGSTTGPVIDCGFEPQWLLIKASSGSTGNWYMYDSMRGLTASGANDAELYPSSTSAEYAGRESINVTATGFQLATTNTANNASGSTYIYIAIRRPMKVPEAGTEVFSAEAYTGNSTAGRVLAASAGFPLDILVTQIRVGAGPLLYDRMRGNLRDLEINTTAAGGASGTNVITSFNQAGFTAGDDTYSNASYTYIAWMFKRAPQFMDIVCYAGNGTVGRTVAHNLGVVPELMIVKDRVNGARGWRVYDSTLGGLKYLSLDTTDASNNSIDAWGNTDPTSTVFSVGAFYTNETALSNTYIAYLFATLAGVSKVGSYTADATLTTINCGFAAGARFILIKRTDAASDWYVYDYARGIVAGNDPYLLWNDTGAEVTATDYIDPENSGFQLTAAGSGTINVNTGEYIFLAIA